MIEPNNKKINISKQCELIGLPRSSYYREVQAGIENDKNLELMRLIDEEYMRLCCKLKIKRKKLPFRRTYAANS